MKVYDIKDFSTITEDGFETKGILISNKSKDEVIKVLEDSIKNATLYDNSKSYEDNERDITLHWVNYGFPDFVNLKWATPKFKDINRPVFVKSDKPLPVPRITFTPINNTKDLAQAIVVNHIQEFCKDSTIYDIKGANGLYRRFNSFIDFGVIVVFCF